MLITNTGETLLYSDRPTDGTILLLSGLKLNLLQVLPVDLTRTIDPKTDTNTSNVPRKLAFSVENILDPTKFTGRKDNCDSHSSNDRNNNSSSQPGLYTLGNGLFGEEELSQAGE